MNDWRITIVCLLLSPQELEPIPFVDPQTWAALQSIAADLELLGPEQQWGSSFSGEIDWCRTWLPELKDAPPLCHALRLPPVAVCEARAAFAGEFYDWLESRAGPHSRPPWSTAMTETTRLRLLWLHLAIAKSEQIWWAQRRKALADIMHGIGEEAFYAGDWPMWVPMDRLATIP